MISVERGRGFLRAARPGNGLAAVAKEVGVGNPAEKTTARQVEAIISMCSSLRLAPIKETWNPEPSSHQGAREPV